MRRRRGQKQKAKTVQEEEGSNVSLSDVTESEEEEEDPKTSAATKRVTATVRRVSGMTVQGHSRSSSRLADRIQLRVDPVPTEGMSPLCSGEPSTSSEPPT